MSCASRVENLDVQLHGLTGNGHRTDLVAKDQAKTAMVAAELSEKAHCLMQPMSGEFCSAGGNRAEHPHTMDQVHLC